MQSKTNRPGAGTPGAEDCGLKRDCSHYKPIASARQARLNRVAGRFDFEVAPGDRAFFAERPWRRFRFRPTHKLELREIEIASGEKLRPPPGQLFYTIVKALAPGLRTRGFFSTPPLHRVEDFSDAACAMFFDQIRCPRVDEIERGLRRIAGTR